MYLSKHNLQTVWLNCLIFPWFKTVFLWLVDAFTLLIALVLTPADKVFVRVTMKGLKEAVEPYSCHLVPNKMKRFASKQKAIDDQRLSYNCYWRTKDGEPPHTHTHTHTLTHTHTHTHTHSCLCFYFSVPARTPPVISEMLNHTEEAVIREYHY